jgi:hypothetical protein
MRFRQEYISSHLAAPGMVLGAPTTGGAMAFSLPPGHALTEDNVLQLERHKLEFIVISVPDSRTEDQVAEDRAQTSDRLRTTFAGANLSDPYIASLFEQVLEFRST